MTSNPPLWARLGYDKPLSNRQLAAVLDVDEATIRRDRAAIAAERGMKLQPDQRKQRRRAAIAAPHCPTCTCEAGHEQA